MAHRKLSYTVIAGVLLLSPILSLFSSNSVGAVRNIAFPIIGPATFSNDYNAPRSNGRHHAIDIFANKWQRLVAVADGTITYVGYPQPSWGYMITMRDNGGYRYHYIHINNDNHGTDDGAGGPMKAYASDVKVGNPVVKGQLLGWVGDSGNAENTPPHLHFEMEDPNGTTVSPYLSLKAAQRLNNNITHPPLPREILPYGYQSRSRVNIAMGNADGDDISETVVGIGPGGTTPQVKLYNDNRVLMREFNAYHNPTYKGGADVAMGDVNGDGVDEIITGTGAGGGPSVKVFTTNGTEIGNFLAYSEQATSGLSVATGDTNADGTDEIITGLRTGSASEVKVFSWSGGVITLTSSFYAYLPSFVGGIDVASADVSGTDADEIITIPISSGGPDVRVYSENGTQLNQFWAYDTTYRRGSRISAGNVRTNTAKAEIVTVPVDAGPHIKMFTATGTMLSQNYFLEEWWRGTYDIGAGDSEAKGASGINRRTTVRPGIN